MISHAFRHRSGRVVSLSRLLLASIFLLAIWIDPTQPERFASICYAILACYVALSGVLLAATWDDWRADYRLALPAHLGDILVFALMVALTEGYTSPFFSFSVFITLSAMIRWGWRAAAATGAAVIMVFFASGLLALEMGAGTFELRRFIMRGSYLIVLSSIIVWFGMNQAAARESASPDRPNRRDPLLPAPDAPASRRILELVAARLEAGRTLFAWSDPEEPWIHVATLEDGRFAERRFTPDDMADLVDPTLTGRPFLFRPGHALALDPGQSWPASVELAEPVASGLTRRFGISEGVAIPVEAPHCAGIVVATGIVGLCADDLQTARDLSLSAAAELRQAATLELIEENGATRTRLAFARDLHDSVMQLLAGTALRLEAIRRAIEKGEARPEEVAHLQAELAAEQKSLRTLIEQLRGAVPAANAPVDLCGALAETAARSARQWQVRCSLDSSGGEIPAAPRLEHELRHMLREAIANAVRHGRASDVSVSLSQRDSQLVMVVDDNGRGCPAAAAEAAEGGHSPRSMRERVEALGGTLSLAPTGSGSRLVVEIPIEEEAQA